MRKSSRMLLGLAAAAALTTGTLATAPAIAQTVNQYAYHQGYSDHHYGYGGYYDGYVGSYGAYNDTPAWGYSYQPAYAPRYYGYGYDPYYGDETYPYGYAPAPGVGVQVGPVGIGVW